MNFERKKKKEKIPARFAFRSQNKMFGKIFEEWWRFTHGPQTVAFLVFLFFFVYLFVFPANNHQLIVFFYVVSCNRGRPSSDVSFQASVCHHSPSCSYSLEKGGGGGHFSSFNGTDDHSDR